MTAAGSAGTAGEDGTSGVAGAWIPSPVGSSSSSQREEQGQGSGVGRTGTETGGQGHSLCVRVVNISSGTHCLSTPNRHHMGGTWSIENKGKRNSS
jgi:hypothetical protein